MQPAVVDADFEVVKRLDVKVIGAEVVQRLFQLTTHATRFEAVLGGASEVTELGPEHAPTEVIAPDVISDYAAVTAFTTASSYR